VLMHELGHVIGLDHVSDQSQIMYQTVTTKQSVFGAGDLAGLQLLGRPAGCLAVPAPPWKK
jgi:predicted Zn-dependent protease